MANRWTAWVTAAAIAIFLIPRHPGFVKTASPQKGQLRVLEKNGAKRKVAGISEGTGGGGDPCLPQMNSVADLKREVQELEANATGAPINGFWQDLDLSKLPRPQAIFLSRYSDWIQASGYDRAGCTDVPCILNRIYNSQTGEEGLKVYLWFLRMGYVLATVDRLPSDNKNVPNIKNRSYQDFLFSRDELMGFWILSRTLPPIYANLDSLQSFHRLPRGVKLINDDTTCGTSYSIWTYSLRDPGKWTSGNIKLLDSCLTFLESPSKLDSSFYLQVSHEMSHSLDRMLRSGLDKNLSSSAEWKAFSGWKIKEVVDPDTGKLFQQWTIMEGKEDFVRDYAASNPEEDWADTVAHFRYDPKTALSKSPLKSAYISKKVFGGRSFDPDGLTRYYYDFAKKKTLEALPTIASACVGQSQEYTKAALNQGIQGALAALKKTEYEACDLLQSRSSDLARKAFAELLPELNNQIAQQGKNNPRFNQLNQLRSDLKAGIDPREAYLKCRKQSSQEDCFASELSKDFDQIAGGTAFADLPKDLMDSEKKDFMNDQSFEQTRVATVQLFSNLFGGVEELLKRAASNRWLNCKTAQDPVTGASMPPVSPFSGGEHFVDAALLRCINDAVEKDINGTRDTFAGRIGISTFSSEIQDFLYDLWLPTYLDELNRHLVADASEEALRRGVLMAPVVAAIRAQLNSDLTWSKNLRRDPQVLSDACRQQGAIAFDSYESNSTTQQKIPRTFAAIEDTRNQWVAAACQEVVKSILGRVNPRRAGQ